jgi:hypothetical protein
VFHAHFPGKGALRSWTNSRVQDVVEIAVRTILDVVDERQGLVRAFLAHGATDRDWAGIGFTREELTDELTTAISAYLAARQPS